MLGWVGWALTSLCMYVGVGGVGFNKPLHVCGGGVGFNKPLHVCWGQVEVGAHHTLQELQKCIHAASNNTIILYSLLTPTHPLSLSLSLPPSPCVSAAVFRLFS